MFLQTLGVSTTGAFFANGMSMAGPFFANIMKVTCGVVSQKGYISNTHTQLTTKKHEVIEILGARVCVVSCDEKTGSIALDRHRTLHVP